MHGAPNPVAPATIATVAASATAYDPGAVVDEYLTVLMKPDPVGARRFVGPGLAIRFTGGRAMSDPAECAAFNAGRYA